MGTIFQLTFNLSNTIRIKGLFYFSKSTKFCHRSAFALKLWMWMNEFKVQVHGKNEETGSRWTMRSGTSSWEESEKLRQKSCQAATQVVFWTQDVL